MMRTRQYLFTAALAIASVFLTLSARADQVVVLDRENGPLENAQVILLALSIVFFLLPVRKASRVVRCVLLSGAMLCLTFILRELDVEELAVPQWVIVIGSGLGRNLLMAAGWGIIGVYILKTFSRLRALLIPIMRSGTFALLIAAAFLLLAGESFDHERVAVKHPQLWEEALETTGYFLILVAAVLSWLLSKTVVEAAEEV